MGVKTILICEDNLIVQDILREYLEKEGFDVVSAGDGENALRIVFERHIDLVLLDIMLPGINGFEVCQRIRGKSDVPIIIVSARGTAPDRVAGLELGADDYVTKPFSAREVVIRIKKLLERRGTSENDDCISIGQLQVFPEANLISINGKRTEMTNKEIQVLSFLIENQGTIQSREQILNAVWKNGHDGDSRVVDTIIKRIRKKITGENADFKLSSVYGKGYKIEKQD